MGMPREYARVTFNNGSQVYWELSPEIPGQPDHGQMLADVLRIALQGDIASIEPVQLPFKSDTQET